MIKKDLVSIILLVNAPERKYSYQEIFYFYFPLFLNQAVINLTAPFLNFGVSRAYNPERALAAFAASFSITIIFNAIIFTSLKVYQAHLTDRKSLYKILKFYLCFSIIGTITFVTIATTGIGDSIFDNILKVHKETVIHAKEWMLWSAPLPVLMAFRCALQSLTTVYKKTINTIMATSVRMITALGLLIVLVDIFPYNPCMASGLSFSLANFFEVIFLNSRTRGLRKFSMPTSVKNYDFKLTNMYIAKFSIPLWASSLAWTSSFSLINYFIGFTPNNEAGLAGFAILRSLNIFLTSPLFPLVTVVLVMGDRLTMKNLKWFGIALVLALTTVIFTIIVTDADYFILVRIFNLSGTALEWSKQAIVLLLCFPILLGLRSFFEGLFVKDKKTLAIGLSGFFRLASLLVTGIVIVKYFSGLNGVFVGMLMMLSASISDAVCILIACYVCRLKDTFPINTQA
ncbi:MAG: hypothetical protein GY729_03200 [Desulfobacteraceae bacterium]|nr:hypothetical protein [Desulfobacteraceae bacterium]